MPNIDPLPLAQALIRCPSVTPEDHGALRALEAALTPLGFACHRLRFEDANSAPVENLYARLGTGSAAFLLRRPHRCRASRRSQLASRSIRRRDREWGSLWPRRRRHEIGHRCVRRCRPVTRRQRSPRGSIGLLITGDEEGDAVNGTVKVLDWLKERGETHRPLHRRASRVPHRQAGDTHQDRPARHHEFHRDGEGHARACGLSAARAESNSRHGQI